MTKQTKQDWRGEKGKYYDYGFKDGIQSERKRVCEIIRNFNESSCGWTEESCDRIEREDLLAKISSEKIE
jgi:hypothetical protein